MNKIKLLISGVLIFNACITTAQEEKPIDSTYLVAMERDLGITKAEMPQYIEAEIRAVVIENIAITEFGDSYAGSWMERLGENQYKYVVATTDSTKNAYSDGVLEDTELKHVNYSLKQLEANMASLNDLFFKLHESGELQKQLTGAQVNAINSFYIDVKTNSIVIKVAPNAIEAGINFVAMSKAKDIDAIRIETTEGVPSALATIYGGAEYTSGPGLCSTGFAVLIGRDLISYRGFVTAGHCGAAGTSVTLAGSSMSVYRADYPGDDMALVRAGIWSSNTVEPWVTRHDGGTHQDMKVRGDTVAAIGSSVCRSGRTTGYRCGIIQSTNATVNYGAGPVNGLTQSTACAGRGDSGGSWITPAGQAQGVTSGGILPPFQNTNCSMATPTTWFQPLREILDRYSEGFTRRVTLVTDRWTEWLDRDNPSGSGDWENRSLHTGVCANPTGFQARRVSDGTAANLTGEVFFRNSAADGLVCRNADQPDNICFDYEVRFYCP